MHKRLYLCKGNLGTFNGGTSMNEYNLKDEYDKRYHAMLESDFGLTSTDDTHFIVTNFDNDSHYNVEISYKGRSKSTCDCPDFQLRGRFIGVPCKHMIYVHENIEDYQELGYKVYNDLMDRFKKELGIKED